MTGMLILARHGESEGNKRNVFTGKDDLALTDDGRMEACFIAHQIEKAHLRLDVIFTSAMKRTQETAAIVVEKLAVPIPIIANAALNERDYGELTGMNKAEAAAEFGSAQVLAWRRSFRKRPPGGESLADTKQRVSAYFDVAIAPHLKAGENVLIVAHSNSLRSLAMELEELSPFEIETFEIATGQIIVYKIVVTDPARKAVTLVSRSNPARSMA